MLVKHIRKDFYEVLFGKRVLIIANLDVDAVCATKILTELMRIDGISFSLCPVDGVSSMKQAYSDYAETVHIVIMINCGISLDIRTFFDNPKDKTFFLLDCHRPVHVANFYDETRQIRIISLDDNFDDIPSFDDLFDMEGSESDNSEEEDIDDDDIVLGSDDEEPEERPTRKRKRRTSYDRRRRKAEWVERRQEIIFNYTQFSYFAPPSTLVALELSWAISRGDMQYVWWATVALTDSFLLEKSHRTEYIKRAAELSRHIAREAHSTNAPRDCLKVQFENELRFYLYRHWNLYESLKMTPYTACVLKTWSLKGEGKFHELLGELGFPQNECRQKYASMDVRFRKKVKEAFTQPLVKDKYKLEDATVASFLIEIGFRPPMSAFDCQLACLALLENPDANKTVVDNFLAAMACLSKKQFDMLDKGIELAKHHLTATYRQVQEFINMNSIAPRGGYLYAPVPAGAPNACYFKNSSSLMFLAQFTQRAIISHARSKRWATLPLVMTVPHIEGYWAVIGIKPINLEYPKNLFGKIFEALAAKMEDMVLMEAVDPHIVLVKEDQKEKFLQLLEGLMV